MALKHYQINLQRLNQEKPILEPTDNWWETGVAFNAASVYLERSEQNDILIKKLTGLDDLNDPKLANGVVVIHYRARPNEDKFSLTRSYIGLAVFSPEYDLIKRYPEPVMFPDENKESLDYLGVEDPRITYIDNKFSMLYCGVALESDDSHRARLCWAQSDDLINWEKLGPVKGTINGHPNKDGVLFPDKINNQYVLLHRPMIQQGNGDYLKNINLAVSGSITEEWIDCGEIMRAFENPAVKESWVGAGSVPIPLDNNRYLVIYHVGNWLNDTEREYDLDAAIFNFNNFSLDNPGKVVEKRMEHMMVPETEWEIKAPFKESVANILFACGSFEYKDDIHIIYGGADTYTLAAKINKKEFLSQLENCDNTNPFA